jgi:predicted RNA-binding protein Jag
MASKKKSKQSNKTFSSDMPDFKKFLGEITKEIKTGKTVSVELNGRLAHISLINGKPEITFGANGSQTEN